MINTFLLFRLFFFLITVFFQISLIGILSAAMDKGRYSLWHLDTTLLDEFNFDKIEAGFLTYCIQKEGENFCGDTNLWAIILSGFVDEAEAFWNKWKWGSLFVSMLLQTFFGLLPPAIIRKNLSYVGTHRATLSHSVQLMWDAFILIVVLAFIRPLWVFITPSVFFFDEALPWFARLLTRCSSSINERVRPESPDQTITRVNVQPATNNQRVSGVLIPGQVVFQRENSDATEAVQAAILSSLASGNRNQNPGANPTAFFRVNGNSRPPRTSGRISNGRPTTAGALNECSLCNQRPRNAVILDCGHSLCHQCGVELTAIGARCPWDRGAIARIITLYHS
ncbi:uncharacterized protein LOC134853135 isoform X3 [Symsagittifera roscoffensis]|uniref:uncharacterized protein LOC134853135 isoform X3 n=1 Tax=Symsagittifera roscoffensis TaxID=84072 RepID=UPI00307B183E